MWILRAALGACALTWPVGATGSPCFDKYSQRVHEIDEFERQKTGEIRRNPAAYNWGGNGNNAEQLIDDLKRDFRRQRDEAFQAYLHCSDEERERDAAERARKDAEHRAEVEAERAKREAERAREAAE